MKPQEERKNSKAILRLENLCMSFIAKGYTIRPAQNISLEIKEGETYGLAGESGSGKSTLAKLILGIYPLQANISGKVVFEERTLDENEWKLIRGKAIGYVPQNFMDALNPVLPVKAQMVEHLHAHDGSMPTQKAIERTLELFRQMGIPGPEHKLEAYPHQLSGGVKQRILIAMAISSHPRLLLCDETTTALDVTTKVVVLQNIKKYCERTNCALFIISHDLAVLSNVATRIGIMYKGRLIEEGRVEDILSSACHPYTQSLIHPQMAQARDNEVSEGACCFFHRCDFKSRVCEKQPPMTEMFPGHRVSCHNPNFINER